MHDVPHWNFELFDEVEAWLVSLGHEVRSPAQHDREVNADWKTHPGYETGGALDEKLRQGLLAWDIEAILWADAVVCLPGVGGRGSKIERAVARALGKDVYAYWGRKGGAQRWLGPITRFDERADA